MSNRPRRSAAQWQALIERQARSSQSAAEFCRRQDLGYANFMQWRSRLAKQVPSSSLVPEPPDVMPQFVELTHQPEHSAAADGFEADSPALGTAALLIEFDLGGGVQLRISRGV